ncbi:MAG: Ig-like domain repeat protein [Kofleriaceae bacterium]|nr:Ig-like domain repeat protein [Myxococcales bacterium]MCB9572130.1 Ig-like domain repeat protein [Kofleriaceae bacterium]
MLAALAAAACNEVVTYSDAPPAPDADPVDGGAGDPPDTTLTATPAALSNQATARFELASAPAGLDFLCAIDGAALTPCTTPFAAPVAEGDHTFEAAAVDDAGQVDPTPASFAWSVDLTPPDTLLVSAPPVLDNSVAVTFEFDASEDATFACVIDGGAATPCASPYGLAGLADGAHRFVVTATDLAGNTDPSGAIYDWTIDTSTPDTQIDDGPTGAVAEVDATFAFSSPDAGAGATFECGLDAAGLAPCASPVTYAGLADGDHAFRVRVVDGTGNADPTPATRTWTVDTVAPTVAITGGPAGPTAEPQPAFTFTTGGDPTTIECRVDAAAFATCTSPFTPAAALGDGAHAVEVRAADAAGNAATASRAFTVDTMAPTVTFTGGPTGPTSDPAPTFTFTTAGAPVTVQCRVDGAAYAACASPYTTAPLADGAHSVSVQATDAAGNVGSASRAFTVDSMGPTVSITGGPEGPTSEASPTFTFTTGGGPATVTCQVDASAPAACTSPFATGALGDGAHTFTVTVTDTAGNHGSASRAFTVDTVAPTVAITGGPSGATSDATPTFAFTTAGAPTSTTCRVDAGAYAACASPYTTAALADGAHSVTVQVADAAGNTGTATRAFTVDTVGPTVTIIAGPSGATNDPTPTFTFTTAGAPTSTTCRIDAGAAAACASPYTTAALADGAHTVTVEVADAAGNTGTATQAFVVDTVAPTASFTGGPSGPSSDQTPTFTFTTGGAPTTTQCRTDAGAYGNCASPYTTAALADGAHSVTVRVIDAAGNTGTASRAFSVDTQPPTVTITSGPTSPGNDPTPTFTFTTAGAPTATACRVDAGAYGNCASPFTTGSLADGDHSVTVRVTDAAGNTGTATSSFTIDTTSPTVVITNGPTGPTADPMPTFAFTTGGSPATVRCRVDGAAYANCASPYTTAALADGAHGFDVRVTDAAGNAATASAQFTVDTVGPTVTITSGPPSPGNDPTPTFTFTTAGGATTVMCRMDGGAEVNCASPYTSAALADGNHSLWISAWDVVGNPGSANWTFSTDTMAPTVAITAGPSGPTNNPSPSFSFTTGGSPTSVQCRVDTGAYANCTSPHAVSQLPDGAHTFDVRVVDQAGNAATASRAFTVDTVGPTAAITGGPTGPTNDSTPTFTFTTSGATVVQCRIDTAAYANCASPYTSGALVAGAHTFYLRAADAAGNSITQSRGFSVDITPPTVSITSGPSEDQIVYNYQSVSFGFATGGGAITTWCRFFLQSAQTLPGWTSCSSPKVYALGFDKYTFQVEAVDAAGNFAIATRHFENQYFGVH